MFLNFARLLPDSGEYLEFALKGFSSPQVVYAGVQMRFAVPFLAVLLSRILPFLSLTASFAIVNCIFWGGGVLVAYLLGRVWGGRAFGLCCGFFFTTSVPILSYGAAVLTDCAGYFFAGLGLLLVLYSVRGNRPRSFLEGAVLTVGGFFHPAAFLGLLYDLGYRLILRRDAFWASLAPIALALVAAVYGPFQRILSTAVIGLMNLSSLKYSNSTGPALQDALSWTFEVSWPFQIAALTYSILATVGVVWFFIVVIIGAYKSSRRSLLLTYLLAMFAFPLLAPAFVERYLFWLWPSMVVLVVSGIVQVGRVPAHLVGALVGKMHNPNVLHLRETLANPYSYVIVYLVFQSLTNTLAILSILGPSPFKF